MKPTTAIPYGRISLFFVFIVLLLTWGFYKTYLVYFPSFTGFTIVHHFHGAMMMTWMIMLIVQPLFIRYKKISVHRFIGKLSFLVAPVVVISIFLAARSGFLRPEPPLPYNERVAALALPLPHMVSFAVFYALAILNRRTTYSHMRYMIGTSLLMIGPGLGRALIVYFGIPFPGSVEIISYFIMGIAALMTLNDIARKRSFSSNLVILVVLVACYVLWTLRYSQFWYNIGDFIAKDLF
jgi:hypothetical protein